MAGLQLIWATVSAFIVSRAVCAHAGGGQRRLDAGMPGADDDDVEIKGEGGDHEVMRSLDNSRFE